jgi:PPOX class probable F420-dependent enzyme
MRAESINPTMGRGMAQSTPRTQRRGRRIAMSPLEIDNFLGEERTCRVATVGGDGAPHVAPLWFTWDGAALWLNSIVKSQRWTDLHRDPRVSVVVDAGERFHELRGVEIIGRAEAVGDVPRGSEPHGVLTVVEQMFARKYLGGDVYHPDGRHAWLRVVPHKVVSWDFRKNPALRPH